MATNILHLFDTACSEFGDRKCIVCVSEEGPTTFTYSDINQYVEIFYNSWKQSSSMVHEFIAIVGQELTPHVVVLINGILKSNNAFVFLDITYDSTALYNIINKLSISYFVGQKDLMNQFTAHLSNISLDVVKAVPIFSNEFQIWKLRKRKNIVSTNLDLAFAVFSSGSTSDTPKIIKVPHSCILPNIFDLREIYKLQSTDTLFISTPATFDPCILDIFLAFSTGACILLTSRKLKYEPSYILKYFSTEYYNATVMYTTPSLFLKWFPRHVENISLRILTLGGEPFPKLNFESWPFLKNIQVFNIYGITEISCWATISRVVDFESVTLGSPLTDILVEVRNNDTKVPSNSTGELYIGSRSRRCFVNDETHVTSYVPLYRPTGDLVKIVDGEFYYVGRKDRRIKIYGHQVDLSNIENTISHHSSVKCCCCIFEEGEQKIIALVELRHDLSEKDLLGFLRAELPFQMIPTDVYFIPKIPLSQHGKISESGCKALHLNMKQNRNPRMEFQKLWIKYTGNHDFSKDRGFLQSGGNSMLALQFTSALERINEIPNNFLAYLLSDKNFAECQKLCYSLSENAGHVDASEDLKYASLKRTYPEENKLNLLFSEESTVSSELGSLLHVICKGLVLNTNCQRDSNDIVKISEPKVKWKHDLGKCVDASPTLLVFNAKIIAVCGSHSGLVAIVDVETGQLLSKIELPNRIESSACVSPTGHSIFIGCYDGNMYCIDMPAGIIKWNFQTEDIVKSTAVYYDDKIYFGSYDRNFYCLSSQVNEFLKTCSDRFSRRVGSGCLLWKKEVDQFPIYATAMVTKKIIVVATLGGNFVFMQHDGAIKNRMSCGKPFFCNPTRLPHSSLCAAVDVTGILRLFDLITYTQVWSYQIEGNVFSSISLSHSTPTRIFFGSHDRNVYCFEIVDRIGNLVWKTKLDDSVYSTPYFYDNKDVSCEEGSQDFIVAASISGNLFILDASKGNVLTTHSIKQPVFSSPAVFQSNIVLGCRNNFLYGLTTS